MPAKGASTNTNQSGEHQPLGNGQNDQGGFRIDPPGQTNNVHSQRPLLPPGQDQGAETLVGTAAGETLKGALYGDSLDGAAGDDSLVAASPSIIFRHDAGNFLR